jgi:arylsulfatase A-like enzyme
MAPIPAMKLKSILLSVVLCALCGSSDAAPPRPNFMIVIADDLCWRDLGYEGSPDVKTPNLDRLRSESMHLRGMFNPATSCSPTRHALYTGLYPIRSDAYPMRTVRDTRHKLIRNLTPDLTYTIGGIHKGEPIGSWKAAAKNDPALAARIELLSKRPAEELYDLQSDPYEMKNLAADPAMAPIKAGLQRQLDAWMLQQKDKCLETENLANTRQGKSDEGEGEPKAKKKTK